MTQQEQQLVQPAAYRRSVIVGVLLAAAFVSLLNQTLLIVAIPPIMNEFGIEPSRAQWVTTAFMLMNGIMIPVTAFLIERFGNRSLLVFALGVFSFGTFLGAVSPNFAVLLAARIFQAMGAGILMPLMQTVLLTVFPPEKRGAAMGMGGLVIGFAPAIGPTLAGWIIDHFTWRYLFYTVLPVALLVLVLAVFLMKDVTVRRPVGVDVPSIVLSSFGWGGLLYASSMVGSVGWSDWQVIAGVLVGAAALVLFIRRQNRLESPMLNFRVFRYREFTLTTFLAVFMFAVLIGVETLLPIYVQNLRGGSALDSGLMLLPGAIVVGAMAPVAGRIYDKFGVREIAIAGFLFMVAGTLMLLGVGESTSFALMTVMYTVKMLGVSLLMTPLMTAGMNALPFQLIAHGTAMSNTIRMVGGSIGTALMVSVMSAVAAAAGRQGVSDAMAEGIHAGLIVALILSAAGLAGSLFLSRKPKRPAR